MSTTRIRDQRGFGRCYRLADLPQARCAYCGDVADTLDHVPGLASLSRMGLDYFVAREIRCWKVPACRNCNATLAGLERYTLEERAVYLASRYRQKYQRLLRMPPWTDDRLEGLRGSILASVLDADRRQRRLVWRLKWLDEVGESCLTLLLEPMT